MRVFEVIEPSLKGPVEAFDNAREALAARAPGLGPDTILETVEALLADITPSSFKPRSRGIQTLRLVCGSRQYAFCPYADEDRCP